jgi:esterase/lipase
MSFVLNPILYKFTFPIPECNYDENLFGNELTWIDVNSWCSSYSIPCLWIKANENVLSDSCFLVFHGNGNQLGSEYEFCKLLSEISGADVFEPEYNGYGIAPGSPSENGCYNISVAAFETLQSKYRHIVIIGSSIGSGPASYLAEHICKNKILTNCKISLVIWSGFTSIKDVVFDLKPFLSLITRKMFPNVRRMQNITCDTLFIHGKRDTLIHFKHAVENYQHCASKNKFLKLISDVGHNNFDLRNDIIENIISFLNK